MSHNTGRNANSRISSTATTLSSPYSRIATVTFYNVKLSFRLLVLASQRETGGVR
jgi:hypothetical protein